MRSVPPGATLGFLVDTRVVTVGHTPSPRIQTTCEPMIVSSRIATEPLTSTPPVVGASDAFTTHDAPGARTLPQVVPAITTDPVVVGESGWMSRVPVLEISNVTGGDVDPTSVPSTTAPVGDRLLARMPIVE